MKQIHGTELIAEPPRSWRERMMWLGPGFLWMVSAAGSGELLFTPRIGAIYGYALLWALIAAVTLKWFINAEIGRFTVCTGRNILEGVALLPGKKFLLSLIILPQLVVGVTTVTGLAGAAASAIVLLLPGDIRLWMAITVLSTSLLVAFGKYALLELAVKIFGITLAVFSLAAAFSVGPHWKAIGAGFVPSIPKAVNFGEVLPWLGFMLSGAAGMMWYSYWVEAKKYSLLSQEKEAWVDPKELTLKDQQRVKGWISQIFFDNTIAFVGALIVALAFLILGTELLKPQGLIPEEEKVAGTLGHLLGGVWGPIGFWFMILAIFVTFWHTTLSGMDGFSRLFAGGTRIIFLNVKRIQQHTEKMLFRAYLGILLTLTPIVLFAFQAKPVFLLKIAGGIEAAHIPVVACLILYLNKRVLPTNLRAGKLIFVMTLVAAMFFTAFAVLYLVQLLGGLR